jgi:hypothetical protein
MNACLPFHRIKLILYQSIEAVALTFFEKHNKEEDGERLRITPQAEIVKSEAKE